MVQVIWNAGALAQLEDIKAYIEKSSSIQARRVVHLIREATRKLERHPEFGAVVPEWEDKAVRELRVFHYRIIYHFSEDKIRIVTIVHGARRINDGM